MKLSPRREMFEAVGRGDADRVKSLLAASPELLHIRSGSNSLLHLAAFNGAVPVLELLVGAGLDVDTPEKNSPDTALHHASRDGRLEACRWLLDHRADVNAGRAHASPTPLISPAINGHEAVVRLLLERGADVNAAYGDPPRNALTLAKQYGRQRVEELLREHGAVEPGASPVPRDDPTSRIVQHMAERVGPVHPLSQMEIIPTGLPIAIHVIPAARGRPYVTLFTTGMSQLAMKVPASPAFSAHAELVIRLPADWPTGDAALRDERWRWPFLWLRRLASTIHEQKTHVPGWLFVSTAEPPEPLSSATRLSCFLLAEARELGRVELPDGPSIALLGVTAVYQEERDWALAHAVEGLLSRLQEVGASGIVDLNRRSVAGSQPL